MEYNRAKYPGEVISMPNTRKLIVSAQLLALDVVFTRLLAISTPLMKIGLGFTAVAMCAILYGPWWTALVAALGDIVGALLFPTGAFFPGFTLTAACTGLIFGLCLYRRGKSILWPFLAAVLNVVLISYLANTAMISYISGSPYGTLLKARAVQLAVMLPVQFIVLGFLSRSSVIKKLLARAE